MASSYCGAVSETVVGLQEGIRGREDPCVYRSVECLHEVINTRIVIQFIMASSYYGAVSETLVGLQEGIRGGEDPCVYLYLRCSGFQRRLCCRSAQFLLFL